LRTPFRVDSAAPRRLGRTPHRQDPAGQRLGHIRAAVAARGR